MKSPRAGEGHEGAALLPRRVPGQCLPPIDRGCPRNQCFAAFGSTGQASERLATHDDRHRHRNLTMGKNSLPTQKVLRDLFGADPATGTLVWRERPSSMFKSQRVCNSWNAKNAGKEALTSTSSGGYFHGTIFGRSASRHMVVFKYFYGFEPEQIDHIDGNITNNRLSNLRGVTPSENQKNRHISSSNSSGTPDVWQRKKDGRWRARITANRRRIHLGYFGTLEEARQARKDAEEEYGYSPRHGSKRPA